MKLLPTLMMSLGLLASPVLLADNHKAAPPAHGEPGHNHATDHGQTATDGKADDHAHEGEAKHDDHAHEGEAKHDDHAHEDEAKHDDHGHAHGGDHGHAHGDEPHHGGIVAVVDGIHHELVMAEDGKISLYAEALPEGDALNSVKVRLTVLKGADKQDADLTLAKGDEHRFEAGDDLKLAAGDKVVAVIQLPEGQPRMARFEIPAAK